MTRKRLKSACPNHPSQVEKTDDLMQQAKDKAASVVDQANDVISGVKRIKDAAVRQLEALAMARRMISGVNGAADKAVAAFRLVDHGSKVAPECSALKAHRGPGTEEVGVF